MVAEAIALKRVCTNALFIVNDRIDVALAAGADGVHIGQDDMPYPLARTLLGEDKIIGVTVHSIGEAIEARDGGADYVGVSPIFGTGTKHDAGAPVGTELIREIRARLSIPIVAIGGITLHNASQAIRAGADAICAISAVVASGDPGAEIRKFMDLFRGGMT
jgi:thiamine-phosphate pyrophosphorylase